MATAIAKSPPETNPRYDLVPLAVIERDPNQPRKTFDPESLQELANSIKVHGIVVPLVVRPSKPGMYMLVDGERRWRAGELAGISEAPCVIERATDKEALEKQLLANSMREDVHPLEEAAAYDTLLKKHNYTMEMLIAKTGRSKAHLHGRTRLLKLPDYVKKVMLDGLLLPAIGELATRIEGGPKRQEAYAKECLGLGKNDDYRDAGVDPPGIREKDDGPKHSTDAQPLTFRQALTLLRRRYMLRLEIATFDTADASLLPKAGACTTCPKRTGNQPGLPGLEGNAIAAQDLCTDADCYQAKTDARWKEAAAAAQAKKIEIIEGKKAKDLYYGDWRDDLRDDAPVVELDSELPYNLRKPGASVSTFGKLLGKEAANVKRVLVKDQQGAPREMLDKTAAIAKLKELGKIDDGRTSKSPSVKKAEKAAKDERATAKAKRDLTEQAFLRFLDQVVIGASKDPGAKELAVWRWIGRAIGRDVHYGVAEKLCERRGLKSPDDLQDVPDDLKTLGEVRAFVAEMMLGQHMDRFVDGYAGKEEKEQLAQAEKLFGASWDKALAAAKDAAKAEAASTSAKKKPADEAEAKAKPAKKKGKR